jgi:hypothetical protein
MPLPNSGNWNPALHPRNSIGEFIYTDGGLHGRPPSASGTSNKTTKKSRQAFPYRAGYRRVGPQVIEYDGTPPNSQTFTTPDGQTFLAPAGTNFQSIFNAGATKGVLGIDRSILWYGTFDFQRNEGDGKQLGDNLIYSAYINASNYAAGVYMNGAGFSLNETLFWGRIAADVGSKNAGSPQQREWQTFGWKAAQAQRSQWQKAGK